jgi:hypothetical protein
VLSLRRVSSIVAAIAVAIRQRFSLSVVRAFKGLTATHILRTVLGTGTTNPLGKAQTPQVTTNHYWLRSHIILFTVCDRVLYRSVLRFRMFIAAGC